MSNRCLQLLYQLEDILVKFRGGERQAGRVLKRLCPLSLRRCCFTFPLSRGGNLYDLLGSSIPFFCLFQLRHSSHHFLPAGEVDGAADDCWQIEANIWTCVYSTSPPSLAGPKKQQKQTVVPQNIGKESRRSTNAARWRTHPASFQKASSGISFLEFLMMICPWYLGKHLMKHCTNSLNSCEPCQIFRRIRAASRWIQQAKKRCLFWSVLNSFKTLHTTVQ